VKVVFFEGFLLPAGSIEILSKIAFLIEKADTDERQAQIASGFEMIAREDAEPAGKDGKALGDAKFEREVGDEEIVVLGVFALIPGTQAREISIEAFGDTVEMGEAGIIARGGLEDGLVNGAEETDGITADGLPEFAIKAAKEIDGSVIPAPTEVVGDLQQRFQGVREGGTNLESSDGLHGVPSGAMRERRGKMVRGAVCEGRWSMAAPWQERVSLTG
jgi:hypothetical protein